MLIQKTKKINKKYIVIIISVLLLGIIGYTAYAAANQVWPFFTEEPAGRITEDTNSVNYDPPTKQEVDSSQEGKKNGGASPNIQPPANKLSLVVTYAGPSDDKKSIEINAYTADVIEGSGTCTATLTKDSSSVTSESKASIDASSSICQPIIIPINKFSGAGSWKLTVKYSSPAYTGTSQTQDVEVNL